MEKSSEIIYIDITKTRDGWKGWFFFVSTVLGELLDVLATFLESLNDLKSV